MNDSLIELPHLLALSRYMLNVIKANITSSMGLNILATILATLGVLGPVTGALVHNIGSAIVIVNSSFLLGWTSKR